MGTASAQAETRVTFIDVGYGDSILMELPGGHVILLDAGYEEFGGRVLAELKERGISRIDTVILSHPHKNHFGGFFTVLGAVSAGRIFMNGETKPEEPFRKLMEKVKALDIPVSVLKKGDSVSGLPEEVSIRVLHPGILRENLNDNSLVLFLEYKEGTVLFTSDIGPEVQAELLRENEAEFEAADVIQIAHHGDTPADAFLKRFRDRTFIVSTGENEWGLPDEEGLARLSGKVFRTDKNGTINLKSDGGSFIEGTA